MLSQALTATMTLEPPDSSEGLRRRLAAKNRHNAGTIGIVLLLRSFGYFAGLLLAIAADLWAQFGAFALAAASFVIALVLTIYSATRWKTVTSSLTTLPSEPGCPLVSRLLSITASPLVMAQSSTPTRSS